MKEWLLDSCHDSVPDAHGFSRCHPWLHKSIANRLDHFLHFPSTEIRELEFVIQTALVNPDFNAGGTGGGVVLSMLHSSW